MFKTAATQIDKDTVATEYIMMTQKYNKLNPAYLSKVSEWEDNRPKVYNLVLHHCPPPLVLKIEKQPEF